MNFLGRPKSSPAVNVFAGSLYVIVGFADPHLIVGSYVSAAGW